LIISENHWLKHELNKIKPSVKMDKPLVKELPYNKKFKTVKLNIKDNAKGQGLMLTK
jgi:hypothetical protein